MLLTSAALCALPACALAPATARAQARPAAVAPAVDDEGRGDNARATRLYREGNEAFKQKRWSDAELLYLKAWALVRTFDIAANLGEVQIQLNKARSAAAFLAFALRTAPPSTKPEQIARIRHFLDEAKAQVGTLRVRVKNATDAEVFVDSERVPDEEVKHEIYVEPGERTLVIRRAGYEDEVVRLVAAAGVTETVMPELKPKAVKAPEASEAGAARQGTAAAKAPGAGGATGAAAKGEAKTKAPAARARVEEGRSWVPVIALGAASAVGLGVAVGFTVAANGAKADGEAQQAAIWNAPGACVDAISAYADACKELRKTGARADTFANTARVAYVASGALAITAATYALWPRDKGSGAAGRVLAVPLLHASGAEMILTGAW
ncbi:PEGA domain-containing protein [Sorangium sp. So ce693]|uniref:PEGA domain-containing protein n=1 Tax=Sorangium sp. So ce693 TaxID=3133318 RepID=UPI003F615A64